MYEKIRIIQCLGELEITTVNVIARRRKCWKKMGDQFGLGKSWLSFDIVHKWMNEWMKKPNMSEWNTFLAHKWLICEAARQKVYIRTNT